MMALGYEATRRDGELTVHRVPIFVECERDEMKFDRDWINQAVVRAKQAESEGYLPPLHIRHHEAMTEANDSVRASGFFRILGTETITFKGSPRIAIMADLVITDAATQADVLAKRLPYRSVEIFNVDKPAIDGLALLDHEAPFLELPMLMVSRVNEPETAEAAAQFRQPWSMQSLTGAVACFRRGSSAYLLFREGNDMTDDDDKKKKGDDAENMADEGGGGLDVGAVCKAIKEGSISVAEMDEIMAAIAAQKSEAGDEGDDAPAEAPAVAAAPGAEAMRAETTEEKTMNASEGMTEGMAALMGKNQALEARIDDMEAATQRTDDITSALKKLEGRPVLGSDKAAKLMAFHREHGRKPFLAYVDSLAENFAALPESDEAGRPRDQKLSEVSLTYQDKGPDAVEQAAKFSAQWNELREHNATTMSEEKYVAVNMGKQAALA